VADFFISYRGTDVAWAQWIAWQLERAGFAVIYQAADFRAGPPVINQINTPSRALAALSPCSRRDTSSRPGAKANSRSPNTSKNSETWLVPAGCSVGLSESFVHHWAMTIRVPRRSMRI